MKQAGPSSSPPRRGGAPRSEKEASSTGSCSTTGVRTCSTVRPCCVLGGEGGEGAVSVVEACARPTDAPASGRAGLSSERPILGTWSDLLDFLPQISPRESGLGKLGRLDMRVRVHVGTHTRTWAHEPVPAALGLSLRLSTVVVVRVWVTPQGCVNRCLWCNCDNIWPDSPCVCLGDPGQATLGVYVQTVGVCALPRPHGPGADLHPCRPLSHNPCEHVHEPAWLTLGDAGVCPEVSPTLLTPASAPSGVCDTKKWDYSCSSWVPLPKGSSCSLTPGCTPPPGPALPASHLTAVSEFLDIGAGLQAQLILIGPPELQETILGHPRAGVRDILVG